MIRFEDDERTHGEQQVLGGVLRGLPLTASDWATLRPDDFAHDLHGRIWRHAVRLSNAGIEPDANTVYASMCDDRPRRERGRPLDGVAEYLEWLAGKCWLTPGPRVRWLIAFHNAMLNQHIAREMNALDVQWT